MAHSFYLKKTTQQPTPIDIQINMHNPRGWIEKSNGQVIKLVNGENHAKPTNS